MPRVILQLGSGVQTADVQASVLSVPGVTDAVQSNQANAVIAQVDDLTPSKREELANQPGVTGVFDDLQGRPLVASEEALGEFFSRVRKARGEDPPSSLSTKPTRPGEDDLVTDGGAAILPAPASAETDAEPEGPLRSATDAVRLTGASALHEQGIRGDSIISVIVDTGSCGGVIRDDRQLAGLDLTGQDDPWDPLADHGGMSTGIMAGDETTPGIEVGFLPESDVFPIKTTLAASELMQAQDAIMRLDRDNPDKTVVVNNSWGFPECADLCEHPITGSVENTAGEVIQIFAAGNEAAGTGGCGQDCDGTTVGISGPNSVSNVITVAASGKNGVPGTLQDYSSRGGPGSVSCGSRKPDLAAPTFGEVPWGCGSRQMGNAGGTSAACPQVAGSVGLLADAEGRVSTESAQGGLQATATQFIDDGFNGCSGAGNIQVAEALDAGVGERSLSFQTGGGTGLVAAAGAVGLAGAVLRRWLR